MDDEKTLPCSEKLVFENKQEAQAAAATLAYQKGIKLRAYTCQHCQLWHLASVY